MKLDLNELVSLGQTVHDQTQRFRGRVYFLGNEVAVKIGFSARPDLRVRRLQTGSPVELRLLCVFRGTKDDERALHALFDAQRLHGEWFKLDPQIVLFMAWAAEREARFVGYHGALIKAACIAIDGGPAAEPLREAFMGGWRDAIDA